MNSDPKYVQERFKQFLSELPPDKRKELYDRISSAPAEKRNALIESIVERYDEIQKKKASAQQPVQQPVRKAQPAAQAKTAPVHLEPVSKSDFSSKEVKTQPKESPLSVVVIVIGFIVVALGIFSIVFKYVLHKDFPAESASSETVVTEIAAETALDTEAPEETPAPTETPTPTPSPEPTAIPLREDAPDLTGLVVVIDPGHQETTSEETEACATWLSATKPRATCGSVGTETGVGEYEVTLDISEVIKSYLEQCGATVILTREENDVDISNQERAAIAVENNADVFLRIHADGSNDGRTSGIQIYVPDNGSYTDTSAAKADELGALLEEETGETYNGCRQTYVYTGLNYASSVPAFQVSLGYLTNCDDEAKLMDEENRVNIAAAFAQFCSSFM